MTYDAFLQNSTKQLQAAGITTARLDTLILIEDELQRDRAAILAHPETLITPTQSVKLNKKIIQRIHHTPLAYIRQKAFFFGREYAVTPHVLVPRPETEALIELLKNTDLTQGARIADVGTGSGCIGITAALEIRGSNVDLYDIDIKALSVARKNAHMLQAGARCFQGNLLANLQATYDILLANLPYVPENHPINQAAQHEPSIALFAGNDGMGTYRSFWQQAAELPQKPAHIYTETFPSQHPLNEQLARNAGYAPQKSQGFAQHFALI